MAKEEKRNSVPLVNRIRSLSPEPASREALGEEVQDSFPLLPSIIIIIRSRFKGWRGRSLMGERGGRRRERLHLQKLKKKTIRQPT